MKIKLIFIAALSLGLMAIAASAQKPTDFSGTWNLDLTKSKLGDRNRIESQTLTVTQTATTLTVTPATKRTAPPNGGGGGGGGRMGGGMGGDTTATYTLDGKEVKSEMQSQAGSMGVSTKAKIDGGKFTVTRTIATQMGDRVISESWELSGDGNTLTVTEQRPNRDGGTDTTTKVYAKKS